MIYTEHRITLDIHDTVSQVSLSVKKGDTARRLLIHLAEKGYPYSIADDCYAVFTAKKPDGHVVFNECTIDGSVVIYEITEQTVAVVGLVDCEVIIFGDNGRQLTSASFGMVIEDTIYDTETEIESTSEYNALAELIEQAKKVDITHKWEGTTLTVTSSSGTSSADLKGEAGAKGDTGGYGPYTTLSRGGTRLNIHCHGLTAGEDYAIHLYTVTRRRGNAMGEWRHPSNANTGVGFTGKGYARLAGQHYASGKNTAIYPEVPSWMPNGGILQTEWEFTAESDTHKLTIDLEEWILPMLKPIEGEDFSRCALIGVSRGTNAPLLMRFKIVRLITGAVGESRNTLRIGVPVSGEIAYDVDGGIGEIYKSII